MSQLADDTCLFLKNDSQVSAALKELYLLSKAFRVSSKFQQKVKFYMLLYLLYRAEPLKSQNHISAIPQQ